MGGRRDVGVPCEWMAHSSEQVETKHASGARLLARDHTVKKPSTGRGGRGTPRAGVLLPPAARCSAVQCSAVPPFKAHTTSAAVASICRPNLGIA